MVFLSDFHTVRCASVFSLADANADMNNGGFLTVKRKMNYPGIDFKK
jgi:hypothetical protein